MFSPFSTSNMLITFCILSFCIFVFVAGFVQLTVVYNSNRPVSNLNATSIGANATKVATYPPKKGRHCLIGVGTKWTIAHLSVRSNSKIERDLRLTGYCVSKTLFGVSSSCRARGIVQRFGGDAGVSGYLQTPSLPCEADKGQILTRDALM